MAKGSALARIPILGELLGGSAGKSRRDMLGGKGQIGFEGGAGGKAGFEIIPQEDGTWRFEGSGTASVVMLQDGEDPVSGVVRGSLDGIGSSSKSPDIFQEVKVGFNVSGPKKGIMSGGFSAEWGSPQEKK